ncbi:Dipeptide transport ATP-binding protein [Quillaja saponaria]|uniref:Dipeptide transport ATP-binding protein n=1 Tax=Quillaja saponaria TaxID=32244 RepID=A0AAD7KR66_QUISA|nr:Dipeptide transport ATP-binding protein [Quillaja saponaria]
MGSKNSERGSDSLVAPQPRVAFCQRNKSENSSFVANLRNQFHGFIHASVDEHKTCLRNSIQKMFGTMKIFGEKSDGLNGSENSSLLQTGAKN